MENNTKKYEEWVAQWLHSKKIAVKESSYIRYKNIINNHIIPTLGNYPIEQINTSLMKRFVTDKIEREGLSSNSISSMITIIKDSFRYAEYCGAHTQCYFEQVVFRKTSTQMKVISYEDEKKLLSVLFNNLDRYKLGVFICLYTGIRLGELCALKWKNLSLNESLMKIECTVQRLQKDDINSLKKTHLIITDPKSFTSIRTIPLPTFITKTLKKFIGLPEEYLLSGNATKIVEPRTMQNKFKAYLKAGNIESVNFHALRHTFATRCVEAGFDAKTLSEILGHSSVKITLDKYVHSSMQLKRSNMEKLQPAIE